MKDPLTLKQLKTINFLESFSSNHGHMPSLTEMAEGLSRTTSTISGMLSRLEGLGYIERTGSYRRWIKIVR